MNSVSSAIKFHEDEGEARHFAFGVHDPDAAGYSTLQSQDRELSWRLRHCARRKHNVEEQYGMVPAGAPLHLVGAGREKNLFYQQDVTGKRGKRSIPEPTGDDPTHNHRYAEGKIRQFKDPNPPGYRSQIWDVVFKRDDKKEANDQSRPELQGQGIAGKMSGDGSRISSRGRRKVDIYHKRPNPTLLHHDMGQAGPWPPGSLHRSASEPPRQAEPGVRKALSPVFPKGVISSPRQMTRNPAPF
jgi:hypothetical protein